MLFRSTNLAQNIGTKGAVNDLLRVRQNVINELNVPNQTADAIVDAMVKRGQALSTPAYAAARRTAQGVEAAPEKAGTRLSELWDKAKMKLLPAPKAAAEPTATGYEGPAVAKPGYEGSDLLDDVMHRMEAGVGKRGAQLTPFEALTDAIHDANGRYAASDIGKVMDILQVPREGTPFAASAQRELTGKGVGEFPQPSPEAPEFLVKLRAAGDVNVRHGTPARPEPAPAPVSAAPNVVANVEAAHEIGRAHV